MTKERNTILLTVVALLVLLCPVKSIAQNNPPLADAGSFRYAGLDPIVLDGTGSFDPDNSGILSYTWRQITGPSVVIIDANTATPTIAGSIQTGTGRGGLPTITIGGFTQTDAIQECEFELVVSDGELTSLPDKVRVVIVPTFTGSTMTLENTVFNPQKPTIVFFGGGSTNQTGGGRLGEPLWSEKANIISFPFYIADPGSFSGPPVNRSYGRPGDMVIVYLSSVAPDYRQPIQTLGFSIGGLVALDVAVRLNLIYADARYAVNHVSLLDPSSWIYGVNEYYRRVAALLDNPVDAEQCWVDSYEAENQSVCPSALNVVFPPDHALPWNWYRGSLATVEDNPFNHGVVAGAYWSVVGPGKNLQLASTPDAQTYKFQWYGDASSGFMDFHDELNHPGRLPEPVTLLAYSDALYPSDEPTGALLTCKESENAVGYQLLLGPDPYRVMDYDIISDTPTPPAEIITTFPFEQTWWTVKARDQYGSTIYADPIRVTLENLPLLQIENLTNGQRYGYIQLAINDANSGDVVVVEPGDYQENIFFRGKNLMLRSIDPNDPNIVAATIINGGDEGSAVTFSGGEDANCVLDGFTITGGNVGIRCCIASPTISNCTIGESGTVSIELWQGSEPGIIDCNVPGDVIVRPIAENITTSMRYFSIQDAINDASLADEIIVSEGIWQENINFGGKNLIVRATNPEDPAIVAATVIKGSSEDSAVTFSSGEDANCVLAGFTITDANNGIYCFSSSPTITNCSISANINAGIKLCQGSNSAITNCRITANGGAGIEMWPYKGGRLTIFNYPIITNCTIAGHLQHGISGGIPTITNSIIWDNSPQQIADTQGAFSVTYSDIQGGFTGEGNIDADPLFADPDNGDYHLKSQAGRWDSNSQSWVVDDVTSPCIDAGDPGTPVGLEPLPNGGIINMGAYGGTAEASKSSAN